MNAAEFLRVEKGFPDPEELAAVTAVLLARAAGPEAIGAVPAGGDRCRAAWRRLERDGGFTLAHSWRAAA
ncbi:acyl-CoA carboxylase subunit epsilon [Streptomyces sp. NPDC050504]|uniref:acyl-CoA carboxylase subunit epsilon n=1 Tax=Streptomyces sp. NPDC050504 TaxID=3365618 RepID=UPI00378CDAFF